MKARITLYTLLIVCVTLVMMCVGQISARAATTHVSIDGNLVVSSRLQSDTSEISRGNTVTVPERGLNIDPFAGRLWAIRMLLAFVGLGVGGLCFDFLLLRLGSANVRGRKQRQQLWQR